MKRWMSLCLLLAMAMPLAAVEDGQVMYAGGTIPSITAGTIGRLDTTSNTTLTFESGSNKLSIPYSAIKSFAYTTEVTYHLGVLPAIAVGLLKARERRHFFRISYRDADNAYHVAVFEVPKQMPRSLQAVLQARAPHACKPCSAPAASN